MYHGILPGGLNHDKVIFMVVRVQASKPASEIDLPS